LQQKAFHALPREDQLNYLFAAKHGQVPNVKLFFPPLTIKEYYADRVQYGRDKYPELYKDVPRLIGMGRTNPWILHVKNYQAKHGCSYKKAMQLSKSTYKKY